MKIMRIMMMKKRKKKKDLTLLWCIQLIFGHSRTRHSPRLFRKRDLLKEIIMTKEFVGKDNHNVDDHDDDYDINDDGDIKSVCHFFYQSNCDQNPCKNNATC